MSPLALLLYVGVGAAAGLTAGLFGLGGGVIVVPALLFLYAWQGFPAPLVPIAAVATSLASVAVTTAASAWAHWRLGALDWQLSRRLLPGVLLGAAGGAWFAEHLPAGWLKTLFSGYLLVVAAQLLGLQPRPGQGRLGPWVLWGAGGGIGFLSALLGIGGGTLTVPFLLWRAFPIRVAVAVSSAIGFPLALGGTLSYAVLGQDALALPPGSLGYVYLPAFFGIIAASALSAPLGAKLAHCLPAEVLKRLFAMTLALIGIKLLYGG